MTKKRGRTDQGAVNTELQELTAQINALSGGDIGSYTGEEAATIYSLYLESKRINLRYKDLPSQRAHAINILEFRLKAITMICVAVIAAITVYSVIWSAKAEKEQSARVDKILQIIPGVLGGLGGGWALGHNWSKSKKTKPEDTEADEDS